MKNYKIIGDKLMRSRFLSAVLFLALPSLLMGDDRIKVEANPLLGTWKVVSIIVNGKKIKPPKLTWTITKTKINWSTGNDFLYKLDNTKKPKHLDFRSPENPKQLTQAIYSLDEGKLKVSIGLEKRPKDFKSKKGLEEYVYILESSRKQGR